MTGQIKERFGRYLILDHLVDGGMAKICRARFLGEQADKVVAIKMVQQRYSKDVSFQQMFMDEIKVTFGLLHPNIVQTYDYGFHEEQLFVAMEYCDGNNLKEYLDRLKQKKFVFPVEISVYISSQICQGLHYAHTYSDKLTGKEANIIHRDISPHNVMLTYDGAIKVIDFGIAKAESNSEATQAGTIKGKLSYLAPEYLDGMELDHRYDQFAVGITLWEMLCSRKLFKANNDLAVLKKIQECKVPAPSSINPNVPAELDEIVLKALSKDRTKRFENMDQLNRALIKFLYANYPDFNASDLSYFAKELFKEEIRKDREKLFEYGKIDIRPFLDDLKNEQEGGISSTSQDKNRKVKSEPMELDFGFSDDATSSRAILKDALDNKDNNEIKVSSSAIKKKVKPKPESKPKASSNPAKKRQNGLGKRGRIQESVDESMTFTRTVIKEKRPVARLMTLVAALALTFYFGKDELSFLSDEKESIRRPAETSEKVKKKKVVKKLKRETPDAVGKVSKGKIKIRLTNFDKRKQKIFVNGKRVKPDFLNRIEVEDTLKTSFRVESPGLRHFVTFIDSSNGEKQVLTIPEMPTESYGYVYVGKSCKAYGKLHFNLYEEKRADNLPPANPLGISFPIYGDRRSPAAEKQTPFEYTVFFESTQKKNPRKIKVSFDKAGQRKNLCDLF